MSVGGRERQNPASSGAGAGASVSNGVGLLPCPSPERYVAACEITRKLEVPRVPAKSLMEAMKTSA